MEEKGTDTNKNKSTNKSNSSLYLFDEAYHKVKAHQRSLRCRSANIHKKISFNKNIKNKIAKRKEEIKKDVTIFLVIIYLKKKKLIKNIYNFFPQKQEIN